MIANFNCIHSCIELVWIHNFSVSTLVSLAFKDTCCVTATTSSTVPGPDSHSVHFIVHNVDGGCGPLVGQFLHVRPSHSDGVVVH